MNYHEVQDYLESLSIKLEASRFHGHLTGLICVGCDEDSIDDWLPMILVERFLPQNEYLPLAEQVAGYHREIRGEFEEDGFNFTALLPTDDEPLEARVRHINRWCLGFLRGIEVGGFAFFDELHDQCAEIIDDIRKIAVVELDSDEPLEDQEFAFMTLSEHLRTAVQLFFETVCRHDARHSAAGVDMVISR